MIVGTFRCPLCKREIKARKRYDGPPLGSPVVVTSEQREVFERAVAKIREECADETMTEGRCLELISADFAA